VGEHREFNFGAQAGHSKSQPTDEKLSLKGGWSTCSCTIKRRQIKCRAVICRCG